MRKKIKVFDIIAAIVLFLIVGEAIIFGLYMIYSVTPTPIFFLSLSPIALFLVGKSWKDEITISQAKRIYNICIVGSLLSAILIIVTHDRYVTYLDKTFINGKIHVKTVTGVDEDHEEVSSKVYTFSIQDEKDHYKLNLIVAWLIVITFGSPFYLILRSKKLITEVTKLQLKEKIE